MKVTRFKPKDDLIFVDGMLWGPLTTEGRSVRLVLDTGAAETVIVPHVLDELGYSPRQGEAISVMRSAVGHEEGYLIRVERFSGLRHESRNLRVHAQDLPEEWNIDGLIGLNYLRQFNYEIRSLEGRICVERVQA